MLFGSSSFKLEGWLWTAFIYTNKWQGHKVAISFEDWDILENGATISKVQLNGSFKKGQ